MMLIVGLESDVLLVYQVLDEDFSLLNLEYMNALIPS